tara:strand:+ start:174 stop:557 length:384 start_codon:yes stop_codon:yes gene_type:complete
MALITNIGTTDLTMVTGLIDASTLDNASTDPRLSIEKISWNTKTSAGYFSVVFDATTDVTAFSLSGNGSWGKSHTAGLDAPITNNAGSGVSGDIGITTTGFAADETISVIVILKKESGYGNRPDYSG